MNITSQTVQQYVRVVLYIVFTTLSNYGITVPDNTKTAIAGMAGLLVTLGWTISGTRLNGLLTQVKEKTGVQAIQVTVDPTVIPLEKINQHTPDGVTATPKGK